MDKFVTRKRKTDDSDITPKKSKTKDGSSEESVEDTKNGKQEISDTKSGSLFDENLSIKDIILMIPKSSDKDCQDFFPKLANFLMNEVILVAGGKKHAMREIEFYWTGDVHPDPFTHKDKVQQTPANWYFHRTGNSYRGGSYKGLDISIGSGDYVGGILIRSVEQLDGSANFVCGPSKTVDHLLEKCKAEGIKELVDDQMHGNISIEKNDTEKKKGKKGEEEEETPKPLYLERVKPGNTLLHKQDVYCSPRVGLYMTKKGVPIDLQIQYVFRNYRYFSQTKKVFKGRHYMMASFLLQGKKPDEISRITGCKIATINKALESLNSGKKKKAETYNRKLTDEEVIVAIGAVSVWTPNSGNSTKTTSTSKQETSDEEEEQEEEDD